MASIDDIISGVSGNTRADFSGLFSGAVDAYNSGRDQKAKNDLRDAFKGGVPLTPDGQPDFGAMAKTLFQKGGLNEGTAAAQLGLAQQNQQFGQGQSSAIKGYEGGQPPIVSPVSSNRTATAVVAPPLNKGGVQGPQGQPATPLPSDQQQDPNSEVVRMPTAQATQDWRNSIRAPQAAPQVAQAPPQPQGQPAPVTNAVTTTQAPATPSRVDQGIAFYSGVMSDPRSPKQNVELAKTRLEALQKSSELTPDQKNYVQYKLEGGKGTMQDFLSETEAGKAGATERAKNDVLEQKTYIDNGRVAQQRLGTLNTLSNIISTDKNLNLGFGSETTLKVKMILEKAGIDVGDLSGAQMIQKMNGILASESTKSLATRPTQFEFKTFLANNPGLALDEKGNIRMLGILSQNAKREVDLGKLARKNQDNWENWDNVVEAYDKRNPVKDPTTGKILSSSSIIAPGPTKGATPASGSAQAAQPPVPGVIKAADGNWYRPDPTRPGINPKTGQPYYQKYNP